MKKRDLYELRRHLVIALDNERRVWLWDLPSSLSEPTREKLAGIVPSHVLDEADRLGLNVWRGRHLAVQAGWMTGTGRVTPEGRRLSIEQGWWGEEDWSQKMCEVLEVGRVGSGRSCFTLPNGRLTAWCPCQANPRAIRTWNCPGRGRMQCPMCERYVSVGTAICSCGLTFRPPRYRFPKAGNVAVVNRRNLVDGGATDWTVELIQHEGGDCVLWRYYFEQDGLVGETLAEFFEPNWEAAFDEAIRLYCE